MTKMTLLHLLLLLEFVAVDFVITSHVAAFDEILLQNDTGIVFVEGIAHGW